MKNREQNKRFLIFFYTKTKMPGSFYLFIVCVFKLFTTIITGLSSVSYYYYQKNVITSSPDLQELTSEYNVLLLITI